MKNLKHAAILFSGGKDSCLALHKALSNGYSVDYLLAVIPYNFDSFMFHKPYLNLLKRQAKMLDIDLITIKSKGIENIELMDLKKLIFKVKDSVEVIIAGGIASGYQGERIKKICQELGLQFYAPLWNYNGQMIWKDLFNANFKVILTKIACEGISKEFLGKVIDKEIFQKLKELSVRYKFRLDFEGGEAESAVLYMPEFKKEIKINFKTKSEGKYRHWISKIMAL